MTTRTLLLAAVAGGSLALAPVPAVPAGPDRPADPAPSGPVRPYDPAPSGPVRPYEPDVAGPANLDTLTVTAQRSARGRTVTFDRTSRTAEGTVPAGARRFVFLFDRTLDLHLDRFPTCAPDTLAGAGLPGCPAGAVVGEGVATAFGGARTPVYAVNTRYADGRRGVIVHVPANGTNLPNTLERVTGAYAKDYRWALDEHFPVTAVPPQERPGTARFELTFGAQRGRADLITQRGPGRTVTNGLWAEFVTGQVVLTQDRARL